MERKHCNLRLLFLAAALVPAFANAAPPDKGVIVDNVPLPVTGSVNATVTNVVPVVPQGVTTVTGSVNANITNPSLAVTGNVGPALPASPFFDEMTLLGQDKKAVGVTGRRLAVTTITISNFDTNTQQLFVFNPVISGGDCLSGTVIGGSTPLAHLILESFKTVQLQYPVPMVFNPINGFGCIAAEVTTVHTGAVVVGVNGFSAP